MMEIKEKQIRNRELSEFEELMKEVSKLSPELIRRFSDVAQGMIIGCSMEKNKVS